MKKSRKTNFFLNILLISMFIVIPTLLIIMQTDIDNSIDGENPEAVINISESISLGIPVYEDTAGIANEVM
ncbi:MAG: hypothetical protein ACXABG_00490 [Promethearchaeota archaeon]|jgi:putative effector of murein hydrolase